MSKGTNIKKGYRQTPIGVIPETWELLRIADAFEICNNLRYPISEEIRKTIRGIYPYYGPTRIQDYINEFRIEGRFALIGEDGDHFLKWRDFPMTLLVEGKFNVNNHAHLITGKVNKSMTEWFYYYFNHRELTPYLTRQGAGRYKLTKDALSNILMAIPPLSEQKKIASILTVWDDAISQTKQIIERLKERNKGLAQQLLTGKKRLKGFKGKWEVKTLGEIVSRITRKNLEGYDNVVTISAQRGFVRQNDFFNRIVASETLTNYYLLLKGEFAYNKSYSNGYPLGAIKRLDSFDYGVVTTLYIPFSINKPNNSDFFKHYFEEGLLNQGLSKIAQEGGRAHGLLNIAINDFLSLEMLIPNIEEQSAIANVLNIAEAEFNIYQKKLIDLQNQKKGLMQKLLTGEVRVKIK